MIDNQTHIQALEQEVQALQELYDPKAEGTGHYNTAIGVLKQRIMQLKG
jgi:hypothetical protein